MPKDVVWTAVLAAAMLGAAAVVSTAAVLQENWLGLAWSGILAVVGLGLAMLALRE